MRAALLALLLAACGDVLATSDAAVADLSNPDDLAVADDLSVSPDLAGADRLPCGEPQMQCCPDDLGGAGSCNPLTAVCNPFGVCVSCGLYPVACCPGDTCQAMQTCIDDPGAGKFCLPCGHQDQPCCYVGTPCVEAGTSCIAPDGGSPICSS